MKNQMMNLFASYSFLLFSGLLLLRGLFLLQKTTLSDRRSLGLSGNVKGKCGAGVCDCSKHRLFLFPDTHKRMHEAVPFFSATVPSEYRNIRFPERFYKQTKPKLVI